MNSTEQIRKIAAKHMWDILPLTTKKYASFKSLIPVNVHGEDDQLLLIGELDGTDKNGNCMAILNPDSYLEENATHELFDPTYYKKTVAKHCESSMYVWTNKINKDGVSQRSRQYKARKVKTS